MKKKLLSIMLIAILALSFGACGGDDGGGSSSDNAEAYELYMKANEQLDGADSYGMDLKSSIAMTYEEESYDLELTGSAKQVNNEDGSVDMAMDLKTTAEGTEQEMSAYYKDGYYYMESSGSKVKMEMDIEEALESSNADIVEFEEDAVKEGTVKDVDAGKEVSFTLKKNGISDFTDNMIENMGLAADESVTIGDLKVTAVIDGDGNYVSVEVSFNMTMETEGMEIEAECMTRMENIVVGGITVELPSDLDTYTEMSSEALEK